MSEIVLTDNEVKFKGKYGALVGAVKFSAEKKLNLSTSDEVLRFNQEWRPSWTVYVLVQWNQFHPSSIIVRLFSSLAISARLFCFFCLFNKCRCHRQKFFSAPPVKVPPHRFSSTWNQLQQFRPLFLKPGFYIPLQIFCFSNTLLHGDFINPASGIIRQVPLAAQHIKHSHACGWQADGLRQ